MIDRTTAATSTADQDEIWEGVPEISRRIKKTERQTYYMLEKKQLPGFKFGDGGNWHMRKSSYLALIAKLEAGAGQAG